MHPNLRVKKEKLEVEEDPCKELWISVHVVADAIREGNVVLQETNTVLDRAYQRDYTGGEIHKELEPLDLEPGVIASALIFSADNLKQARLLLRDVAVYYHFAISTFPVKIVIRSSAFILEYLLQLPIRMPPKRTSTSETPTITLAAIQQLIANGIATALEAQAATMASASNPNRNTGPTGIPLRNEDEFYNLVVKGNDLKTYIRRFLELAVLCPNMVPNTKKLMEVFISGLPRSIKGNVTASKPQTLEEATNIA
ncbi:hypothetical protein Tco_0773995 [Tanacetum coccineum]|uniref:Reverse transcriptase domain-containing protein n=1 Tax=Tanacetum coccineum TaxID=301880 RepID=A0ABQ4ZMA8_9ASTR